MRDKILQEALTWYENQHEHAAIEDFIDLIISRTAESLFEKIKNELKTEFESGNLQHSFFISDEYYLDLKFKDIKNKCCKNIEFSTSKIETTDI